MFKKGVLIERWRTATATQKLVVISIVLSILYWLLSELFSITGWASRYFLDPYLSLSGSLHTLLIRPWTLITYMWFHSSIGHLFVNMLLLYLFGTEFSRFFSYRQTIGLYILSGIIGGLFYPLTFELMELIGIYKLRLPLYGASASLLGLISAIGMYVPHKRRPFFIVTSISYRTLSIVIIMAILLFNNESNLGGTVAHLGGILSGALFGALLRTKGIDITQGIGRVIDRVVNLFSKSFFSTRKHASVRSKSKKGSDQKKETSSEKTITVETILEKVKRSGYSVLTQEERNILFQKTEDNPK
ncbi:hypothetical protein HQ36_05830 [Porphyromonas gingivicanis]|uniref:Peptidase S54 rhomboid domain-containing protein n=1 Tax=Porphyromonas gingivicanis TaxID=266762 RepID=A0A0A2G5X5_9PORP|nr:rhomboid family intramembrane serine protease [Porphyromonas gingivicanis]KGN97775.1 hypothetical protein HQ36_05830 [Porphyromonas gingivicanis]